MKPQFNQWKSTVLPLLMLVSLWAFGEQTTNAGGVASAGKPKLQIQRTANSDVMLLTLSGAEPKKYYILSTPGISNLTWSVETMVDGALSPSAMLSVAGRSQAFFIAISEDEFNAGNSSNLAVSSTATVTKSAESRGGGREWFVDRQNGRDGFDGHSKQRNTNSGPLATIKKAMTLSQPGDSVTVASGTYPENLDLRGKNIAVKLEGNVILQ